MKTPLGLLLLRILTVMWLPSTFRGLSVVGVCWMGVVSEWDLLVILLDQEHFWALQFLLQEPHLC